MPTYRNPSLAAAMAAAGFTGRDLAEETGTSETTISNLLCRHRSPLPIVAKAIARALDTTVEALNFEPRGGVS